MKVLVRDLKPNPWRKKGRYPLDPEKIASLRESIRETSFWDNIVARKSPDGDGIEIAYGHHRLAALKAELGSDAEVNMIVRPLNDEDMFKIMARENLEEWNRDDAIVRETVRTCVEGYAAGQWSLRPSRPSASGSGAVTWRFAPGFSLRHIGFEKARIAFDDRKLFPYTAEAVERETGIKLWRVEGALKALAADEADVVPEEYLKNMESRSAQQAREALTRVHSRTGGNKAAVARAAREMQKARERGGGFRSFPAIAKKVIREVAPGPEVVDYNKLAKRYAERLNGLHSESSALFGDLLEIVRHADEVLPVWQSAIIRSLDKIGNSALKLSEALRGKRQRALTAGKE